MKTHASFNLSAALLACAVVSASAWNTRALAEPSVEIIMDNAITDVNGAGGDSPGVVAAGSWSRSTSTSGFYGVNYWNDATKNINKTVTYTPALPSSGLYEVQMWWPAAGNFCAAAPVDICHSGDTETVTVNQRTNGGKWNTLGIFEFTATGGEFVKIRTDDGAGGTIGGAVIADAVRFVKVEPLTLIDNALTNVNSNVTPLAPGVSVSSYWANAANASAYGVNYWHDSSKSAAKSVTYTPVLPDHGQYEVQMWWPASADFCDAVPVDIVHSGSTVTVYINQQANGGKWNSLGVFEFARNGAEYVKIRTDNGAGGTLEKRVVADAVRFVEPEAPPPNTAPTITTIADQVIAANTATGALAFTVGDAQTPPAALVVSAASSNPTLLPETGIVLGGSGADRTVTLTPAAGQTGGATVTLTVSDGDLTAQSAFTLTVQSEPPPNTAPTITAIANQVIDANTATGALAFTVGDAQTPPAALVVSAASSNPTLLPETGIVLGGSGADRTVTLTPASGQTGGATVTLTVSDGTLTAQSAFTLTVQTPEPPPPPEPLTLIDNALTNVNSNGTPLAPGVMNGGFWASSTGKSGYYGANYWNDGSKNATKSVTYTPVLPAPGQYEVQMWWPASTEFCANVPVDIVHSGATDTVYINQQANGGKWNSLGTYEFTGDGTEYVKIRTDDGAGGTLSGTIVADAVRFIEPQPPPEPLTLIDNAIADVNSNNSDSPGVTHQSFWSSSTSRAGYHGSNYWTDGNSNKGVRSVTYTPVLPAPGRYMVQMWWPAYATNFATNVPVDIRHNGGTSTVLVNQRTGGAMWFTAGIFEFAGTGDEWLRIRTDGTDGFVIADAVRFVALDEQGPFVMAFDELSAAAGAGYSSSCRRPFGAGLYDSVSNKTYVCWNGPGMDILVRAYDHDAGAWGAPVLVCDLNYTARYVYHNYPVMRLAPDGRLVIYFCDHSNKLFQAKAPAPNSIEGAWARTEISADLTAYPMPVVAGNDIYVFYSKNNDINWPYRAYRYIKSTDNGATWSAPFTIIDSEKNDPQKYDEVYAWGVDYDPDAGRIGITWTMAGGPAHNSSDKNLYFAWLNLATGAMLNAAGASQGPIVNNSDLPDCLVVAATGDPTAASWGKQHPFTNPTPVRDLLTGNPIIAYGFHDAGAAKDSIRCARWDGAAWADSLVQLNAKAFGDLRNHGDGEIHAIYQTGNSILVKVSQDRGATWEQVSAGAIPFAGQDDKAGELTFIENGRPDAFAFLGTYFEDATKPELGGNNYDGIFHTYIVKEDTSDASAPVFLLHPDAGDGVGGGSRLDLTATASGNPVPSYQWQVKEGDSASWRDLTAADTNYGGINTDTLTIWYVGVFMNGWQHRVTASNTAAGAVYSDATTIVVLALPSFDENPVAAQAVAGGKSVDIHAIVSSDTPLTLQWQVKEGAAAAWRDLTAADTACTGIDTATLTLLAVATGMDGWQYRLVATNALGENHTVGTTLNVMPAHFAAPVALVFGSAGNLYVSDAQNNRIHQITPVQKADIFAGSGLAGLVDGIGFAASFSAPRGLAVLSGTLLVADSGNAVLRAINADGNVTTLLGAGAGFASPAGVAVDAAGNIYIADEASHVIRVVTSGSAGLNVGICAGLPGEEGLVDGTGTGARFRSPSALALGADGNLYVADTGNDAVRIVMPLSATTGVVDTLADAGDGVRGPRGIAVTGAGDGLHVYVANTADSTICDINEAGAITLLAGPATGVAGFKDGAGESAWFDSPQGLALGADGTLYVADTGNAVIRKVTLAGGQAGVTTPLLATGSAYGPPPTPPAPDPEEFIIIERDSGGRGNGGGALSIWSCLVLLIITAIRLRRDKFRKWRA